METGTAHNRARLEQLADRRNRRAALLRQNLFKRKGNAKALAGAEAHVDKSGKDPSGDIKTRT
jgi:hypothetical protein